MSRARKKSPPVISPRPAPQPWLVAPERLGTLFVGAGLVIVTLLVYCPCFDHPFINLDDEGYVTENPHVAAGLSAGGVRWAFTTFDKANWHPLTWLSLELDAALYGGLKPGGFHLTNVLLHAANTLLLFLVLRAMTGAVWRSAAVAGLFALHPLHVESVAWVAERKDVLSTLFWMLTLAAYLHYTRRPGPGRSLLVALALALGLLAKPMPVTLPFVLLLLDYWPLGRLTDRATLRRLLLEKLPLFGLVLASCVMTYLAQSEGQAVKSLEKFPLGARVANALLAYVGYLRQTFWPTGLALYYPHPGADVSLTAALGAGVLLLAVTALALALHRRRPYLAVGWLWYLGTLVPVIGLVQVGWQAQADRYTYVPLIGVFVMLVWGAADLAAAWRLPRLVPAGLSVAALVACAVLSWIQLGYWRDSRTLWEHTLAVTEKNIVAHSNLGRCYREQGHFDAAARQYEQAVAVDPGQPLPHVYLGNTLKDLGRLDDAIEQYRQALRLDPDMVPVHVNLGNLLAQQGHWDGAVAEYRTAIGLHPDDAPPHFALGIVLTMQGRREEAVPEYQAALRLDPGFAPAHFSLGSVLQELGRLDEAAAEYQKAAALGYAPAAGRLQACERMRQLRPRLPALAEGRERPADDGERLAFAELCARPFEGRYALAVRLYTDAFAADPALAADPRAAHRAAAALAAARAGWGQGQDAAGLSEAEKARLRGQALDWLRADLAARTEMARSEPPQARAAGQQALWAWRQQADAAGLRDLAKLPADERQAWQDLWRDLDAALARAGAPALTAGQP